VIFELPKQEQMQENKVDSLPLGEEEQTILSEKSTRLEIM
jgi:hypothetical protein